LSSAPLLPPTQPAMQYGLPSTPYVPSVSAPYVPMAPYVPTVNAPYIPTASVPYIPTNTPFYGPSNVPQVSTAVYGPSQVVVAGPSVAARQQQAQPQLSSELQYYKRLGQQQTRQHRINARDVSDASNEIGRASLVNTLVAGSGKTTPWFPIVRLGEQKQAAEAYRSEKQIANRNAQDAYQRYQQDPSHLNLLVSKYQDLNADLRDAAYHYNVINSGTFGQSIVRSGLFGGLGTGLFGGLTQIISQRQQTQDLQDIQRQMQRVARQIQTEARGAVQQQSGAQNSVQQRLMAGTVYGPQQRGR